MAEDRTDRKSSRPETGEGFQLPAGFAARMRDLLTETEYEAFLSSYGRERCFSLRFNPLKADRGQAESLFNGLLSGPEAERLANEPTFGPEPGGPANGPAPGPQSERPGPGAEEKGPGAEARACLEPVPWEKDGFYYPEALRPGRLPWHEAGMYYIQEASAMVPAMLCGAQPGERVLDLCAAPGGKSTRLAADLAGKGLLVANEIHPERAKILSANLERMGVRNAVVTSETPQRLSSRFPFFFDRIVVDAPCSGEGMFRKEEEAVSNWSLDNVLMCADRQMEILEEAAAMLRPGGILVYSTCTFAPEEDEGVIRRFLSGHADFCILPAREVIGSRYPDAEKRMRDWGFSGGRPEWADRIGIREGAGPEENQAGNGPEESPAEKSHAAGPEAGSGAADQAGQADPLRGTVRLWPHLVRGEGHFAAVLRKKAPGDRENPVKEAACGAGTSGAIKALTGTAAGSGLDGEVLTGSENRNAAFGDPGPAESPRGIRGGKKKKEKRAKDRRAARGRGEVPERQELRRLWREFMEDSLVLPEDEEAGRFFREENLCFFGNALYGMPVRPETLPLDGLRVLRAGLQLGTAGKGRFEPSHSLGMALKREEVRRAVDLSGTGPEAYAWLRGESIPVDPACGKGWTLVLIDGCAAGWGKVSGGILKNHYPKGLRKTSGYR